MSTGYTYEVTKGQSVKEFIARCAYAMGALYGYRDSNDRSGKNIPKELPKPKSYNEERLEELDKLWGTYDRFNSKDWIDFEKKEREEHNAYENEYWERKVRENKEFDKMIGAINKIHFPKTHLEFKKFMIDQLTISKHDLVMERKYHEDSIFKERNWETVKKETLTKVLKDISYHNSQLKKEMEHYDECNEWLTTLHTQILNKLK